MRFYFFDSKKEIIPIFDCYACEGICIDPGSLNFVDFSSCGNSLISLIQPVKVLSKVLRTIFVVYLKFFSQFELSDSWRYLGTQHYLIVLANMDMVVEVKNGSNNFVLCNMLCL